MSRVVAILASPRRDGNSSAIADAVVDGAMGLSTNIINIHCLNKLTSLHGCQACERCKSTGRCMQSDDLLPVLDDVRDADAIVVAVPVYFGQPCAQYRAFEDRLYGFLGKDMKSALPAGKRLIVIVTCGGDKAAAQREADRIEALFMDTFKCVPFGKIVYVGPQKDSARKDKTLLSDARGMGFALWQAN